MKRRCAWQSDINRAAPALKLVRSTFVNRSIKVDITATGRYVGRAGQGIVCHLHITVSGCQCHLSTYTVDLNITIGRCES